MSTLSFAGTILFFISYDRNKKNKEGGCNCKIQISRLFVRFGVGGAHPGGINLTKEIFKSENISTTSHILDVGCGTGQTAAYIAHKYGAKVTGIDINSIMVAKATERMKKKNVCQ